MAGTSVIETSDETGSLLPLMSGLIALVMIVAGGLVSLADVQQERRWLYQFADEVVLQSSKSLDTESYYRQGVSNQGASNQGASNQGASNSVPLDISAARALALSAVDEHRDHQVELTDVQMRHGQVVMTFTKTVDLLFGPQRRIEVTVAARAR